MLIPFFIVPGIGGDLPLHIKCISLGYVLLHYFRSLVPDHDPVPFGAPHLLAFPVAPDLIGGQGKVSHKSLPIPFRYPGYLTYVSYECYSVYSVFHNAKDFGYRD